MNTSGLVRVLVLAGALLSSAMYATREAAAAFEFCPVSISAIHALQYAPDEAYRKAIDTRFGIELQTDAPAVAGGELALAAGGQLYRVRFSNLHFARDTEQVAARGFIAAPLVVAFDRRTDLDYAWVTHVEMAGTSVACPLQPFKATHEFFNQRTLSAPERARRIATNARIALAARGSSAARPVSTERLQRACATPDQSPALLHSTPPRVDLSTLRGPTAVSALVYISPAGLPLDVQLVGSSNLPALDRAVVNAAQNSLYAPARIDCMPSAGVYLFRALFQT
ncbi:MAG: hypothetical protein NVS1B14_10550 [Vulcanimicrobiaceae bacterium]